MERSRRFLLVLFFLLLSLFSLSLAKTELTQVRTEANSHTIASSDEILVSRSRYTDASDKDGVLLSESKDFKENVTDVIASKKGNGKKGNGASRGKTEFVQDDVPRKNESGLGRKKVSEEKGIDKGNSAEVLVSVQDDKKVEKYEGDTEIKEKGSIAHSVPQIPLKEKASRGEVCDPQNRCVDEEDQFVACLRVPGNESPDLSLLIQNKGKGPVSVAITAPIFVHLETSKVQLQMNEDMKVKVSIKHGGRSNSIILRGRKGYCSLDFQEIVMQSFGRHHLDNLDRSSQYPYYNILSLPSGLLVFAAVLILIIFSIWVQFRKNEGNKYQRIDLELSASKVDVVNDDSWNENWGNDSWDDEETPKTPTMPITPSVSAKGLASRRLSKEAWKD